MTAGAVARVPAAIPPRRADSPVPLSAAQRAAWTARTAPGVHRALRLHGPVDHPALRRGLDRLADRHEVLRTTFGAGQVVHARLPVAFEVVDVRDIPAGARHAQAGRVAESAVAEPFDPVGGPLWRVVLVVLDAEEHLLVLSAHRLVCDEWSCDLLLRELLGLLTGTAGDEPSATRLQYADFAQWQVRQAAEDDVLGRWRAVLGGVPPVLELPADHGRPATPTGRAGLASRELPEELGAGLRALAVRCGVSLSTVVLTAFAVVLHRYSGQDRFVVGAAVSGRDRPETEEMVGPLAVTIALPVDLSAGGSFADVLGTVHGTVLEAAERGGATVEEIAAEIGETAEQGRNPLYQVSFHSGLPNGSADVPGLRAEPVRLGGPQTTPVDLGLTVTDGEGPVELALRYALDLYEPESAERFADAVVHVLEQVAAKPAVSTSALSVVPDGERDLVVWQWNDTAAPYPSDKCLHELFEEWVARTPDAPAVVDASGNTVSYRELDARANRLAHHLRELGVGPESFVGVCADHSVEMFVALLGTAKAGGAYLPLDPEHPADRLGLMLADTGARVVVTLQRWRAALPASFPGTVLCLDSGDAGLEAQPDTPVDSGVSAQNLVYVMYTSGSTGRPKGVLIPHRGLNNYLWWAIEGYGLDKGSGAPMVGSIAFDLSVPNFFLPLIGGKAVRLLPVQDRIEALADLLAKPGDFSLLKITPGHLDVLRGLLEGTRVTSVGTFVVGADEVRPETVVGWQRIAPDAVVIDEYGPTETVVGCSVYPITDRFDPSVPLPIGKPIANIRMHVLDDRLHPVPIGVVGELYIGGDGVARGYLGRPDLTADRFLPDPFSREPGARFYRSGDLARRRADGDIEFLGRIDHQVKINGYRVELGEVEARLLAHPRVSEAVVVARVAPSGQKRLIAYVVGTGAGQAELAGWLAGTLPGYMVPARIVELDRMPLTRAGKVDRDALPEPGRPARKPVRRA
ncbi:amino acid adenylation domain-containing protein [Lentzea sp. NPDC060358]|uniref:non-ribosomal peptide synthetase n=1 Tax=Lentzea sp. NPDC060358 TaxID=3347103 RepID=UPI00364DC112